MEQRALPALEAGVLGHYRRRDRRAGGRGLAVGGGDRCLDRCRRPVRRLASTVAAAPDRPRAKTGCASRVALGCARRVRDRSIEDRPGPFAHGWGNLRRRHAKSARRAPPSARPLPKPMFLR
ncbi:hypothetical protein THIOKS13330002 [Thiocapsa sp. KS1]|nr:hypothetical protein THIOKS13330002 [Thiocapsa sp. KS1]